MKLTTCPLCSEKEAEIIHNGVRGGGGIDVLRCKKCSLVRLSEYMDDADGFYEDSGMREGESVDLKILRRDTKDDDERRFLFTEKIITGKRTLDFGCGDGGYLIRARNIASDVVGVEIEKSVREALIKEGMSCFSSVSETGEFDVITMFHVLEHLVNPIKMLHELMNHLPKGGKIIVEVPNADDALLSLYNSEAFADFTYWKCHVYLYTADTLRLLAKKANIKVNFIKHIQRYPLENHLHWLSKGKPGGHLKWSFLNNEILNNEYANTLAGLGISDTIIAEFEK